MSFKLFVLTLNKQSLNTFVSFVQFKAIDKDILNECVN